MNWAQQCTAIFGVFNCCMWKQSPFLEFWYKAGLCKLDWHDFVRKFWVLKFDLIWPDVDVSSSQKWMPSWSCTPQMAHKACVALHSCHIFIWWPYLTWPCSGPLLSIRPIFICYLFHPLGSLLSKFGFTTVVGPVLVADEKSDDSELWPDLDLTCNLFKVNKL